MSEEKSILEGDLNKEEVVAKDHDDESEDHEDTEEQHKQEIEKGEVNEDVYTEEGREVMEEDDEISPEEEGFAKGVEEGAKPKGKEPKQPNE